MGIGSGIAATMQYIAGVFARPKLEPMFPCCGQMMAKDIELFNRIGPLPVLEAVAIWRETYPEDFTDLSANASSPNLVKPRLQA